MTARVETWNAALAGRSAMVAVASLFGINGMLLGGIGGSLPAMRDRLGIDAGGLSILLLSLAISAVISMQIGGRLSDAIGARPVSLVVAPLLISAVAVLAVARSLPLAMVGMVMAGLANGTMDVAMNSLGVQVEKARPRPIMSFLHGFFSIGNLAGAGTIVLVARLFDRSGGTVVLPALLALSVVGFVLYLLMLRFIPVGERIQHHADGVRTAIPRLAWLLGLMAFCFGLAEGTAVDWSSVHVTDVARIDPSVGALGLVAVSGFMVVIRLVGDRAVDRVGRRAVVRLGGVTAVAGYLLTVFVHPLPLLLAGWALVGLGVGLVAPQVYAVAGHVGGGRMLATVVTFGYAAFLVGPAVIGQLVQRFGIQHAMVLPLVLAGCLVAVSGVLPRTDT